MSQLVPAADQRLSDPAAIACLAMPTENQPPRRVRRSQLARRSVERGLVSAEWTFVIIAAIAIVGILVLVITNGTVENVLVTIIRAVLKAALGLF